MMVPHAAGCPGLVTLPAGTHPAVPEGCGGMQLVGRDSEGGEQWAPCNELRKWLPNDQLLKSERDDDEIWRERADRAHRYMSILTKRELNADELDALLEDLHGICAIRKRGRKLYEDRADAILSGDWDCLLVRAARWNRVQTSDFCHMHGAGSVYEVPDESEQLALRERGINYEGGFVPQYEHCSGSGEWPFFVACLHGNVEMARYILEGIVGGDDDYTDTNRLVREHPIYDVDYDHGNHFTAGATALNMLCILPGEQAKRSKHERDNLLSRKLEIARLFFAKYSHICRLGEPRLDTQTDRLSDSTLYTSMLQSLCLGISTHAVVHTAFTVEMIKLVLEHGADPNAMVPDSRAPLDATFSILYEACVVARREAEVLRSWHRPADAQRCYEAVRVLMIHSSTDPNKACRCSRRMRGDESPLDFAWAQQDTCLIDLLQKSVTHNALISSTAASSTAASTTFAAATSVASIVTPDPNEKPLDVAWAQQDAHLIASLTSSTATTAAAATSTAASSATESASALNKRRHRTTPILERAQRVGLAHQLRAMPAMPANGAPDSPYKKARKAAQTYNVQLVSREEDKVARQLEADRVARITNMRGYR